MKKLYFILVVVCCVFTHFESLLGSDDLSQSIADDFEWMNKFIIKSSWIRDKYLLILADKICCFVYLT